jgi:hypothetical protein
VLHYASSMRSGILKAGAQGHGGWQAHAGARARTSLPVERQRLLFGIRERGESEHKALGFELDFIWPWLLDHCIGQFAEAGFITAHL